MSEVSVPVTFTLLSNFEYTEVVGSVRYYKMNHVGLIPLFSNMLFNVKWAEIKAVKKRKERAKELEGIDMSNIITSSRRRSTSSFIPLPPPPKIEADSDDDEDDDAQDDDEEDEENVEGGDKGDNDDAEAGNGSADGMIQSFLHDLFSAAYKFFIVEISALLSIRCSFL